MTAPVEIEIRLFVTMRADGAWDATSDESELLSLVKAAAGGCVVQPVKIRLAMTPPSIAEAKVELDAAGVAAIASLVA